MGEITNHDDAGYNTAEETERACLSYLIKVKELLIKASSQGLGSGNSWRRFLGP